MKDFFENVQKKFKTDGLKIKEAFNKSIKTEDPGFNKKMNYVKETERKVTAQFNNVKLFMESAEAIMQQTELMGQTMRVCYKETIYERLFEQVESDMAQNKLMCDRNNKLLAEQKVQIQNIAMKRKLVMEAAERREEKRCWYDHYRVKTQELKAKEDKQRSGISCGPGGDREKIIRNMDKLAKAETEFKIENANVDKLVKEIHTLANTVLNELTIRFTVQVQLEYYEQMDRVFSKVKDLEMKMAELAYS